MGESIKALIQGAGADALPAFGQGRRHPRYPGGVARVQGETPASQPLTDMELALPGRRQLRKCQGSNSALLPVPRAAGNRVMPPMGGLLPCVC